MDRPWISSGFKIGMISKSDLPSLLIQRTARLRGIKIQQHFLYYLLRNRSFSIHCKPTETTVPHISIKDINTYSLILPPGPLQNQFAEIARKTNALKQKMLAQSEELENQFQTLMQKAFKGEL